MISPAPHWSSSISLRTSFSAWGVALLSGPVSKSLIRDSCPDGLLSLAGAGPEDRESGDFRNFGSEYLRRRKTLGLSRGPSGGRRLLAATVAPLRLRFRPTAGRVKLTTVSFYSWTAIRSGIFCTRGGGLINHALERVYIQ